MEKDKKVFSVKKWNFEITTYEDGTSKMSRINDGFSIVELYGLIEFTKKELSMTMEGYIKPDVVERKYIAKDKS